LLLSFSYSVVSDYLWPHGLQHTRLPSPSPSHRACSNSSPLNWWCHPTISSFFIPFFSSVQSVQSLNHVRLFATPSTTARQASLSITNPRVHPNQCPLSWWCHPTISSSVVPFSSCLQSFPTSGSFQIIPIYCQRQAINLYY